MGEVFRFKRSAYRSRQRGNDGRRFRRGWSRTTRRLASRWLYGPVIWIGLFGLFYLYENGSLPSILGKVAHTAYSATAIDGDSLRSSNEEIRLVGIDAPELFQTCLDEHGRSWACGRAAHSFLQALSSRGVLACAPYSNDRYGRKLSTCSAGPIADVGEAMVRGGHAVNFMDGRYDAAEAEARDAKRGIWRGSFERPQEWRRRKGQ